MLKPTIKEVGLTKRERYLSRLAERTFFGIWSFPNPYTDEGISKNKIGKELCDLLVIFEKDIIIFSDKDISFNGSIDISLSWKRWFKRSVIESCAQLYGAESWIKKYPDRIYLDKKCKNKFPVPIEISQFKIHLISVTCNTHQCAKNYWDGSSSSTFIQVFEYDAEKCMGTPFHIGNLYPNKTYVHVLDEESLNLLLYELDTISDFINYLDEKERSILAKEVISAAGEEELLAHFFRGKNSPYDYGKMVHPTGEAEKNGGVMLLEGLWEEYKSGGIYGIGNHLKNKIKIWDNLIDEFSRHVVNGTVGRGKEFDFEYHEKIIRQLASENRAARIYLGSSYIEKFEEVPKDRRSARLVFSPANQKVLYIFIFLPRSDGQDYDDYRKERAHYITAYSLVAKYLNPNVSRVVAIATEPKNSKLRSEDLAIMEIDNDLTDEEKNNAKELMEKDGILSDTWKAKHSVINPLTKEDRPYRNKNARYGRNEKCPCGSGKKYKKCCI